MSKKKKGGIRKFFWFLFYFIFFSIILSLVVTIAGYIAISSNFPSINTSNMDSLLEETSFIYDDAGNITEKVQSNVYRTIVPIEEIPSDLQQAFIAIEDERFYEHNGVDIKRVFGALIHDIKAGSAEQGASTLTMQLSKNLLTSSEKSAVRKLTDMVYAIELEKKLSKSQILYAYLNTVFLGSNVNGVQAAAKSYFNKDVKDINLAEAAVIAGITKYPTKYIPYKLKDISPSEAVGNLQIKLYPPSKSFIPTQSDLEVYANLRSSGKIDQYEYILLKKGSLVVSKAELNQDTISRQKVILKKMLELGFINDAKYKEALNTPITISFPPRNNNGISSYFNDKVKKEAEKILIELGNSQEKANELIRFGGLKIYTTLNTKMQKILESQFANDYNFPNSFTDKDGVIQPQAAMVVIDQKTGYVKAIMGGRGQAGSYIYDRADSPRQPGSAIKPLAVYMLAFKDGMSEYDTILDAPRKDSSSPTGYWPRNIYDVYYGQASVKKLIEVSSNVAAVKTLENLGSTKNESIGRSLDYLQQMGFNYIVRKKDNPNSNDEVLSIALGGFTKGVTPIEMASAYSGIANLGKQVKPTFITKILDSSNNVIYENKESVFEMSDEYTAYRMTKVLNSVVKNGSGRAAILDNMPAAGKTGTTDSRKDFYFAGYTPYYTASVWIGADTPVELNYTSAVAAGLWRSVMNNIDAQFSLKYKNFDAPAGSAPIDNQSNYDYSENDQNQTNNIDNVLFDENSENNSNSSNSNTESDNTTTNTNNTRDNNSTSTNNTQAQQQTQPQQQTQSQQQTQPKQPTTQPDAPPTTTFEDTNNKPAGNTTEDTTIF